MLSNHHDRDADDCGGDDDLGDDEDHLVGGDDDGDDVDVDGDVDVRQVEPDPSSGDDHVQQAIQRLASRSSLSSSSFASSSARS